jgi:hypothetical protein
MSEARDEEQRTWAFWATYPDHANTRANELYRAVAFQEEIEAQMFHKLLRICGVVDAHDTGLWPFHEATYDAYDYSVELHCEDGSVWEPTEAMREAIWKLGFSRVWVRHGKVPQIAFSWYTPTYHESYYVEPEQGDHEKAI